MQSDTQPFNLRRCGINPHHWYVVARSGELKDQPLSVTLWKQAIALYRDSSGKVCALEDRCPHRQVKLSQGQVKGNTLECAYHGWCFNSQGECETVPYLTASQKPPRCKIRTFPVKEQDGFIWLFLGEENPDSVPLLGIPEWEHLNYIPSVAVIDSHSHYSFLIENLMDMYHGHLHEDYQAWASASLKELETDSQHVNAVYEAQSYYRIDKIWSISQLFFPKLRRLHPEPLTVSYIYPHWVSTLGDDFKIYCLFCPVDETHTRAYLVHFVSLNAFWRLHKLPIWFRRLIKNSFVGCAQTMLEGLVRQDVVMMEQEQQAYLSNAQQRSYELNPAVKQVQRLIRQKLLTLTE